MTVCYNGHNNEHTGGAVMNRIPFTGADILLPKKDFDRWAVVACDQFTSQPEYWEKVSEITEGVPSTGHLILPEAYLGSDNTEETVRRINNTMEEYLEGGIFDEYRDSMIFVERTLPDGSVRRGIVGAVDLEEYDYSKDSDSQIRATEGTVLERIPPRVAIRRDASLELPHIMILYNDPGESVVNAANDGEKRKVYEAELMLGGGHISGYLLSEKQREGVENALCAIRQSVPEGGVFLAIGDGNHSLATAKECYRLDPTPLKRYALVELVNIHDSALVFEPIYRVLFNVDSADLKKAVAEKMSEGEKSGTVYTRDGSVTFRYDGLSVAAVQNFIDGYIDEHPDVKVDYIHGEETTRGFGEREGCAAFIFDGMDKSELFPYVENFGALPRKTFSMGEAASKRYYFEARKIR